MGLRINTNVPALNTARQLRISTSDLNRSLERLSSGLRINRARDDAAGLAIAEGLRAQVRGLQAAQRNDQDAVSLVQTAEGALNETTNILQRIRELAVQAATGTVSDTNRAALQDEVAALISQIDTIADNTEFSGISILDGTPATLTIQAGSNFGQTLVITLSAAQSDDLKVNTGFAVSGITQAASAIATVDSALQIVNTVRASYGALQNRLEFSISTLAIQEENMASSESAIRDADIARETIRFTRNQILLSAGTSILAQANIVPQSALALLR